MSYLNKEHSVGYILLGFLKAELLPSYTKELVNTCIHLFAESVTYSKGNILEFTMEIAVELNLDEEQIRNLLNSIRWTLDNRTAIEAEAFCLALTIYGPKIVSIIQEGMGTLSFAQVQSEFEDYLYMEGLLD